MIFLALINLSDNWLSLSCRLSFIQANPYFSCYTILVWEGWGGGGGKAGSKSENKGKEVPKDSAAN